MFCAMGGVCVLQGSVAGCSTCACISRQSLNKPGHLLKLGFIFMICRMWQGALLSFQCLRTYCNRVRFTVGFSYKANAAALVAAQNLLSL